MARIRSIKPEFFTSDQLAECSTNARLLFIGMWVFADDKGRHAANMRKLKLEIFPGDSFSDADIAMWFRELWLAGLIQVYKSRTDGVFFVISGWRHQKIDRPQPARFPCPFECELIEYSDSYFDEDNKPFVEHSSNDRRAFVPDTIRYDTIRGDTIRVDAIYSSEVGHTDSEQEAVIGSPFETIGKTREWQMPKSLYDSIAAAYPDIDLPAEFLKAKAWIKSHPENRKTARGMPKFLNGWIQRAQNDRNGVRKNGKPQPKDTTRTVDEILADDVRREQEAGT